MRPNFELVREDFYLFTAEMYDMTSRVSRRQNIFLEDLLEKQASFRAGTSVRSVLQHILSPLRDFEFVREMTARRNRIDANKRRLRRIFLNLFPMNREHHPHAPC